jgi:hypothetical protein
MLKYTTRPEQRYDRVLISMERMATMSLWGVTAHGSPGGPLQFDRLEAALAARFPLQSIRCRGSFSSASILRKWRSEDGGQEYRGVWDLRIGFVADQATDTLINLG